MIDSVPQINTKTCNKCGGPLIGRRCNACKAAYTRQRRWEGKEPPLSEEAQVKANARSYANAYQHRGKLLPEPCAVCGTTVDVEKHHPDYRFPLAVMWLCHRHHQAMEAELRKADRKVRK